MMLAWSLTFLILSLISAVFGFSGIAAAFADIGKILFVVFLVLFLVSLVTGGLRESRGDEPPPEPVSEETKQKILASVLWFALVCAGIAIGIIAGSTVTGDTYRKQAIDHGFARYHPTTGTWEWVDKAEK